MPITKHYDGAVNGIEFSRGVVVASRLEQPQQPTSTTELEAILHRAIEVPGSREAATRWLGTPVRAVDYATPISRLSQPAGLEEVIAVLGRLEHGVL